MMISWHEPWWSAAVLVVAVGTCLLVAAAAVGARLSRSAVWQRAFWQVAILSILALLAAEATGFSSGVVQWWRLTGIRARNAWFESSAGSERPKVPSPYPEPRNGATADWPPRSTSVSESGEFEEAVATGVVFAGGVGEREPFELGTVTPTQLRTSSEVSDVVGDSSGMSVPSWEGESARSTTAALARGFGGGFPAAWLAVVWGLGTGLLLAHLGVTHWQLLRFRQRQPKSHDLGLRQRIERLAARLGCWRRIDVLVSSKLATPIAFGVLRPVIALPKGFLQDFDLSQQDAMLAHEVAHLAARDPVWQLLADLAATLLWWHPAVWWARRRWHEAGELAADEASLLVPDGADSLAACLVELARRMEPGARCASLAAAGPSSRSGLGRRVERLLELSTRSWRPVKRGRIAVATVTMAVFFLLVAISCTAWARAQAPETEGATTMKVFVNCWRQSLAAVTLAAVLGPVWAETSESLAAEAEREAPRVNVEREREGEREGDRERREVPREHAERKPEARPERERDEAREAPMRELAQRRAHLQEEAEQIRRNLRALQPHQEAERRELTQALERIEVQLHQLEPHAPGRERIHERLEDVIAAERRAAEAGRMDEAERLGREVFELKRMLEQPHGDRPPAPPEAVEAERRLHHLRMAIDNLRAAGLHDQAKALAREGERLVRGERLVAPERERRPEIVREAPGPAPQLERAVHELRGQVQELRHQMEEIRQHLKELAERP